MTTETKNLSFPAFKIKNRLHATAACLGLKLSYRSYLFVCFEDIASECVVRHLSSDIAEDLHVLRVMGHIEDPGEWEREREGGGG